LPRPGGNDPRQNNLTTAMLTIYVLIARATMIAALEGCPGKSLRPASGIAPAHIRDKAVHDSRWRVGNG
jgi:hypothetical protein